MHSNYNSVLGSSNMCIYILYYVYIYSHTWHPETIRCWLALSCHRPVHLMLAQPCAPWGPNCIKSFVSTVVSDVGVLLKIDDIIIYIIILYHVISCYIPILW
jgi:hypothetical protein